MRKDVLDDPAKAAAIGDYVGRAIAANNWKDSHADEWINAYYVKQQGITFDQGKKLYDEDGVASYYPIDAASTALFQTVADGLYDTGTTKTHVDVAAVRRRPIQRHRQGAERTRRRHSPSRSTPDEKGSNRMTQVAQADRRPAAVGMDRRRDPRRRPAPGR